LIIKAVQYVNCALIGKKKNEKILNKRIFFITPLLKYKKSHLIWGHDWNRILKKMPLLGFSTALCVFAEGPQTKSPAGVTHLPGWKNDWVRRTA
jgi:hypothetical protein